VLQLPPHGLAAFQFHRMRIVVIEMRLKPAMNAQNKWGTAMSSLGLRHRAPTDDRQPARIAGAALLALVALAGCEQLAIGIVVDDAIVEGAAHNIERGMSGHDAAIRAMDQLFGPIIGITLVLISVFLPAAFLPGLTGRIYAQFALVIAATALLSAVNAVTLKPTQCALWLRALLPLEQRNWFYRGFNIVYNRLEAGYTRLIALLTRRAGASVIVALMLIAIGAYGLARVPTGFLPIEDQGYLIAAVQLPRSTAPRRCLTGSARW
jgi:multidrug efflux pump subunit AcrB